MNNFSISSHCEHRKEMPGMSIVNQTQDWLNQMRAAYANSPQLFQVLNWLHIAPHVLNDYPCRPISSLLIYRLFCRTRTSFQFSVQGIHTAGRVFCFMTDPDTGLQWRFTLVVAPNLKPPFRVDIVSAYPSGYPNEKNCCYHIAALPKCTAFKNRSFSMP